MTQDKTPQDKPNIAEAVARVLNPDLFSDNLEIAHTAASPYKLDLCKLKALQRALASKDAEIARLREALGSLVAVVGNMRVPQTPEEAGVQIMLTIGPSLERARQALEEGKAP